MTGKIKEFKGSLNVIFDDGQVRLEEESTTDEFIVKQLAIDNIKPRSDQPRKTFHEESLNELAASIKTEGIIQPITVKAIGKNIFEIVAGERRWRAAKRAGLQTMPCLVRSYDRQKIMSVALIENLQREDLNPLEVAQGIAELLESCQMTHEQIAVRLGKSRTSITNLLRLLNLEETVKSLLREGHLDMGHARAVLALSGIEQIRVANLVKERSLSVRETEKLIAQLNKQKEAQGEGEAVDLRFMQKAQIWQTQLSRKLASEVKVLINAQGEGKLIINFSSIEEGDWLLDHISISD